MSNTVDDHYYEVARSGSIASSLLKLARSRMYRDFLTYTKPTESTTILDVGVSDVHEEGANWLEVQYPHKSQISACGLGEEKDFHEAFPEIAYRKMLPHEKLPYKDKHFDIATSNAVLEHVGSMGNQSRFIGEMIRVARRVFVTVPHRYFPVEHHTGIPLLHYLDVTFAISCKMLGKTKWAQEGNLILMSRRRLRQLCPPSAVINYSGLNLGPFSSNLLMYYAE